MGIYSKIKKSLVEGGILTSIVKIYGLFVDKSFDRKYGSDTVTEASLADLDIESPNRSLGVLYQPSRVLPIRRLFETIQPDLPPNPVLVDLGCGKGRVMMLAAEYNLQDVRGVEFAKELCEIANNNYKAFIRRNGPYYRFVIHHEDASDYDFDPEENIIFMYNPFKEIMLNRILENLSQSLQKHPRNILLIYHQPKHKEVLEDHPIFFLYKQLNFWGYSFCIYSNDLPQKKRVPLQENREMMIGLA